MPFQLHVLQWEVLSFHIFLRVSILSQIRKKKISFFQIWQIRIHQFIKGHQGHFGPVCQSPWIITEMKQVHEERKPCKFLNGHIETVHKGKKSFKCNVCDSIWQFRFPLWEKVPSQTLNLNELFSSWNVSILQRLLFSKPCIASITFESLLSFMNWFNMTSSFWEMLWSDKSFPSWTDSICLI